MRINPEAEKLHISNIVTKLEKYRYYLCDPNDPFNIEVVSMIAAARAYQNLHDGILPILYGGDTLKECCHYVASAMDLIRYIEKIGDKKKIKCIKDHLKLFGTGGFGISATYQKQQCHGSIIHRHIGNQDKKATGEQARDAARKSIELMLALAALNKFDDVTLEDPNHSTDSNPNPDLIIKDGKSSYGIACKSITSLSRSNFKGHIECAIKQLKKAIKKGCVDQGLGIVFIDVSAMLDHDKLFLPGVNQVWYSQAAAFEVRAEVNRVILDVLGDGEVHKILGLLFKKSDVAPCVVIYAHSLMIAGNQLGGGPHYYKPMHVLPCGDHSKVITFLEKLNAANHCQ